MGRTKKTVGLRSTFDGLLQIGVLLQAEACVCVPAAAQITDFMELASVNAARTQAGNGNSNSPQSSDDGRFVVFVSAASNLVANDTYGALSEVLRRDFQTNTTAFASVNSAGTVSFVYTTTDGTASERCDYQYGFGSGHLRSRRDREEHPRLRCRDAFTEPDETLRFTISNPQGVNVVLGTPSTQLLTILANDSPPPATNLIDETSFFVRQHYLDFLNREPDASGFQF